MNRTTHSVLVVLVACLLSLPSYATTISRPDEALARVRVGHTDALQLVDRVVSCPVVEVTARGLTTGQVLVDSAEPDDDSADVVAATPYDALLTSADNYTPVRIYPGKERIAVVVAVPEPNSNARVDLDCVGGFEGVSRLDGGELPDGDHLIVNSAHAVINNTSTSRANVNLCMGTQDNLCVINDPTFVPSLPHPDFGNYTFGALGGSLSYQGILGGYDAATNAQSSWIIGSPHAFIGPGDGSGHTYIIGAPSSLTVGDVIFGSIIGGRNHKMVADRSAANNSTGWFILGGNNNAIESDGNTFGSSSIDNTIVGGSGHTIRGSSRGGVITGGGNSAIVCDPTVGLGGSDSCYGNKVSGYGSLVTSYDDGSGTLLNPDHAEATGLGARSWLSNMRCHSSAWGGGEAPTVGSADALGTAFAEHMYCDLSMGNFDIAPGNTEFLFNDRNGTQRPFVIDDSIWSLEGRVVCADRNLDYGAYPEKEFIVFDLDATMSIEDDNRGDARILDASGILDADDRLALTVLSKDDNGGALVMPSATLIARNGTVGCADDHGSGGPPQNAGSPDGLCDDTLDPVENLFGGFDIEIDVPAGVTSGAFQCSAGIQIYYSSQTSF